MNSTGKLFLIPTPLGDNPPLEVLPISVKKATEFIDYYIVENEKTARRFIKKINQSKIQSDLKIKVLNKYTSDEEIIDFLDPCLEGNHIGLLSEAGCPGVADPGSEIVKLAHNKCIEVVPLSGPSSIILALMSSGMNGQNFAFNGYLPIENVKRKSAIKKLEKLSFEKNQTQIFIETPYRNDKMLEELCKNLNENTRLCIAVDITLPTEKILSLPINLWKKINIELHKRPAIYLIHKD